VLQPPLPDSVQEIADVIGRERALLLIGRLPRYSCRGATNRVLLYVPKLANLTADHKLVGILGRSDAERLCRVFGGETLKPANCAFIYKRYRDSQIVRLANEGLDSPRISELMNVSASQVRLILQRARARISQEDSRSGVDENGPYTT
jgi:hypothetical protein